LLGVRAVLAISYERIFLIALDVSGGFGDTILNGVLPLSMVWLGFRQFAPRLARHPCVTKGVLVILLGLFALAFAAEVKARCTEAVASPPPAEFGAECSLGRSHALG